MRKVLAVLAGCAVLTGVASGSANENIAVQSGVITARIGPAQMRGQKKLAGELRRKLVECGLRSANALAEADELDCNVKGVVSDRLVARIVELGGRIVSTSVRFGAIHAFLPARQVEVLADDPDVRKIQNVVPPMLNRIDTSEGDVAHRAKEAREKFGLTGRGVKIGVISDSSRWLSEMQSKGDLPSTVKVLAGRDGIDGGDIGEGTAMMEIVHDLCPDASLCFASGGDTEEEMAESILALQKEGCKIIVDDMSFITECAYQDGIAASAVNEVVKKGCVYVTCAANKGNKDADSAGVWEGDFCKDSDFKLEGVEYEMHKFSHGYNNVVVYETDGKYNKYDGYSGKKFSLKWSDPLGGSGNDYMIVFYVTDYYGNPTWRWPSEEEQDGDDDPYDMTSIGDLSNVQKVQLVILKKKGAADRCLRLSTHSHAYDTQPQMSCTTEGQIYGHNAAESAISVAAIEPTPDNRPFNGSDDAAYYTSDGPRLMFYDPSGKAYSSGKLAKDARKLNKPDVAAAAGVSAWTPEDDGDGGSLFSPFGGTSASAPHVAAIVGLMLEANPDLTAAQVKEILCKSVFGSGTWNRTTGYGTLDAFKAVEAAISGSSTGIAFGSGKGSTFAVDGATARISGVANLTWEDFTGSDYYKGKCFVDSRIVDAEKSSAWVDDNYWCTALNQMDMLVWSGWAADIGYTDVDKLADFFRTSSENLIRRKPKSSGGAPTEGTYGYAGVFDWFADQSGGCKLPVKTGTIGKDFPLVLSQALDSGRGQVQCSFMFDCSSKSWMGMYGMVTHSVLICGYVCSGTPSSSNPSALTGLFLIDSDNDQYTGAGGASAPNSISYHKVTWDSSSERYVIHDVWGRDEGWSAYVDSYGPWTAEYAVLTAKGADPTKVATPVLDPPSNMVFTAESLAVKCTCATAGAEIHFTTNGDAVAKGSEKWPDGGLVLTDTTTVKARAYKDGLTESDEVSVTYTYSDPGGTGKRALDPVVAVGKKDRTEAAAAATYTGWLHDASGNLTGSFTMKVGKANKGFAKVTLTVTDQSGQKKKYTGNYDVSDGKIAGGDLEDLAIGEDGVVGTVGSGKSKSTLTGARNAPKEADQAKVFDTVFKGKVFTFAFTGKNKSISGSAAFSVKFSAKGKAKISGTLMDGSKVSTSAQLVLGDGKVCALPIAFSKKGKASFGLVLWFSEKALFKEATSIKTCRLSDGMNSVNVAFEDCDAVDGAVPKAKQLLVSEKKVATISMNGTKWVATGEEATAKPKLSYAVKTGLFTGSYKATVKGVAKPVTAKITGAWLGNHGVGTASAKVNKETKTWPVEVK